MTNRKRYYELKAAGLCVQCAKPVGESPSKVKCRECHEGKILKPKTELCIHCNQSPAVDNHCCEACKSKNQQIKQKLTNKALAVNPKVPEGRCRVCRDPVGNSGMICDECFRNTSFTKYDALACYDAECGSCNTRDIDQLRFISTDVDKPMDKYGPDLYKLICFSKRRPTSYTIACHACYREICINYVKEVREFFDRPNETEDPDIIDL